MFKKILKYRAVSILSLVALLFVWGGAVWSRLVLHATSDASPLIIHFDDLSGITLVGSPATLVFMAVFGTAVVLMNFFIALELDARDRFLGKLVAAVTLVFAALLFIGFAAIISVN
jgi:hypothetical protein